MSIRHLLGLDPAPPPAEKAARPAPADTDTEVIRRIAHELEQLEPERRRYLAGLAYILGRVANADLVITPDETAFIEKTLEEDGDLPEAQAVLVVQIAKNQTDLYGGTENFRVTREFTQHATEEQRRVALAASFAVVASDNTINADEAHELGELADELGVSRSELNELRRKYADRMTSVQSVRAAQP
jgi:uncharacterized tellurite resistance protein B-like protein